MAKAESVNAKTFDAVVLESETPVLVDFWASWCPPCKAVEPVLDDLAATYEGRARIAKLQVDRNPGIGARYGIQGVPTFLVFVGGKPVDCRVGALSSDQLSAMIQDALAKFQGEPAAGEKVVGTPPARPA